MSNESLFRYKYTSERKELFPLMQNKLRKYRNYFFLCYDLFSLLCSFAPTIQYFNNSKIEYHEDKPSDPVDFSKNYPQKKMRLQDMADIEYVALETTDDILLGGSSTLSAVTDKYILVHEVQRGDIFLFDRKTGKLFSYFNHQGQSGQEYFWIMNGTVLDEKKEEILLKDIQMPLHNNWKIICGGLLSFIILKIRIMVRI